MVGPSSSSLIPTTNSHGMGTGGNHLDLPGYTAGTPGDVSTVTGDLATTASKISSSSAERETTRGAIRNQKLGRSLPVKRKRNFPAANAN